MKKILICISFFSATALAEIQPERIGVIRTLPESYPSHWIIAQDSAFFHMSDGKFIVLDADSDDPVSRVKGMFNGSFLPQFNQATTRPEMYIVETFHARNNRGERTDVLTIYDKTTLAPAGEVIIPPKRASEMPTQYNLQLVDDEKIALIYNFTPATSVSVVNIVEREFLGEVPIPGCALVYPLAGRTFGSLCNDGSMLVVELDENGQQVSSRRSEPFFDPDADPIMERAAMHDGVAYFPSFLGNVQPVDLSGNDPVFQEPWSLVGDEEGGWRPGGMQLAGSDASGHLYILMHPEGGDGTHKDPGSEVWVFDTASKQRIRRIELQLPAISIALTNDENPLLIATNINLNVDVYDAGEGAYLRTLSNFGHETPLLLHGTH